MTHFRNALLIMLFHPSNVDATQISHNNKMNESNPYSKQSTQNKSKSSYSNKLLDNKAVSDNKMSHRLNILASLCSLGLAAKNTQVLESIAVWMQQICNLNLNGWSSQVGRRLVAEYCSNSSSKSLISSISSHPLIDLPPLTPLFTTNLISCWAHIYAKLGGESASNTPVGSCQRPPSPLLSLIVSWLQSSPPSLLLTSILAPPSITTLPGAAGDRPTVSLASAPITALLRWCVEAPFFLQAATESYHRNNCLKFSQSLLSQDSFQKKSTCEDCMQSFVEEKSLYNDLHLSLLKCLHDVPNVLPSASQRQVIHCDQMITIVEGLIKLLELCNGAENNSGSNNSWRHSSDLTSPTDISLSDKMESVNRLAMVVLVATNNGALYGNTAELTTVLRRIPVFNRLLKMMLTSNNSS